MLIPRIIFIFVAALALPATSTAAFKCESADGKVMFTDQPCPSNHKSESISIKKKEKSTYTSLPSNCSSYEVAEKVSIGMAEAKAYDACGYPDDINRTQTAYGVQEQWVYGTFPRTSYVYIENGVVTSIQD